MHARQLDADVRVDNCDMYVGVSLCKLWYILPDGVNIYYLVKWLRPWQIEQFKESTPW